MKKEFVIRPLETGDAEAIDELCAAIDKFMK